MWKVLLSCLLILSSVSVCKALTLQEYLSHHEEAIEEMCEAEWSDIEEQSNNDIWGLMRFPGHYECGLSQYYALKKVVDIIIDLQNNGSKEDRDFLDGLLERHYVDEFDTYDFVSIHIDWLEYIE